MDSPVLPAAALFSPPCAPFRASLSGVSPPSSSELPPSDAAPSVPALTPAELEAVRTALGPTASVLATAVAKLYACPRGESRYSYGGVWGALVLVVDRAPPTSKALRIYSLHTPDHRPESHVDCLFAVQLYESMAYLAPNHLFHTFEIDEGLVGLSFGDQDAAQEFLVKVRAHIPPHGTVPPKSSKKPGFLSRLFGMSGGGERETPRGSTISAPTEVVKCQLPEEWQTLFQNAKAIASSKAEQRHHAHQLSLSDNNGGNNNTTPSPSPQLDSGLITRL